jgi:hypothetical protein
MRFRTIALMSLAAAASLAGCAPSRPEVTIATPITAAELAPYKKRGTATVVGRAVLKNERTGAVTCRGQEVLLTPAVAYNRQTVAAIRAGQKPVPGADVGSSQAYWRKAVCDAQGRFRFHNVPAAQWFVSIPVNWPDEPREGALIKEIRVPAAGTVAVQLSERDVLR